MAESSALLVDEVFPHQPVRQWVLSFPFQLRFLFASRPVITGLLERDAENSYLTTDAVPEDPMNQLLGHSITYRIAVGPQAGRKVFTLQILPACESDDYAYSAGKVSGFSQIEVMCNLCVGMDKIPFLAAHKAARLKKHFEIECEDGTKTWFTKSPGANPAPATNF